MQGAWVASDGVKTAQPADSVEHLLRLVNVGQLTREPVCRLDPQRIDVQGRELHGRRVGATTSLAHMSCRGLPSDQRNPPSERGRHPVGHARIDARPPCPKPP